MCTFGGGFVAKSRPALATPWTVARQAPLSMGFSRQEYQSGLPFPPPGGIFPTQGSNPGLPRSKLILCCLSYEGTSISDNGASLLALVVMNPPASEETQEPRVRSLGREDPLETKVATHSSILARRIPWSLAGYSPKGHKRVD